MKMTTAAALGIAAGLAISAATTWRPTPNRISTPQRRALSDRSRLHTTPNQAPAHQPTLPTITVDGSTYGISPHASPIPGWYVNGKQICINGTISDLSN